MARSKRSRASASASSPVGSVEDSKSSSPSDKKGQSVERRSNRSSVPKTPVPKAIRSSARGKVDSEERETKRSRAESPIEHEDEDIDALDLAPSVSPVEPKTIAEVDPLNGDTKISAPDDNIGVVKEESDHESSTNTPTIAPLDASHQNTITQQPMNQSPMIMATTAISPSLVVQSTAIPVQAQPLSEKGGRGAARAIQRDTLEKLKEEEKKMLQRKQLLMESLKIKSKVKLPSSRAVSVRQRTHRDILLEEMSWMATDFIEERYWKKSVAVVSAVALKEYFQSRDQQLSARKQVFHATNTHMGVLLGALDEWYSGSSKTMNLDYSHSQEETSEGNHGADSQEDVMQTFSSCVPLGDAAITTKAMSHTIDKARAVNFEARVSDQSIQQLAPHQCIAVGWIDAMTKATGCGALACHREAGGTAIVASFLGLLRPISKNTVGANGVEEVKVIESNQSLKHDVGVVLIIAPAVALVQWQLELATHCPCLTVATLTSISSPLPSDAHIILVSPTVELTTTTRTSLEKRGKYAAVVWDTRCDKLEDEVPKNVDECGWWQLSACSPTLMSCPKRLLLVNEHMSQNISVLSWRAAWLCPCTFRSPTHVLRWISGEQATKGEEGGVVEGLHALLGWFQRSVNLDDFDLSKSPVVENIVCGLTPVQNQAYLKVSNCDAVREALKGKCTSAAATALNLLLHPCFFQNPASLKDVTEESETKRLKLEGGSDKPVRSTDELVAGSGKLAKLATMVHSLGTKVVLLAELPSTFQLVVALLTAMNVSHETAIHVGEPTNQPGDNLDMWHSAQQSVWRFNRSKSIYVLLTTTSVLSKLGSVVPTADSVIVLEGCWDNETAVLLERMSRTSHPPKFQRLVSSQTIEASLQTCSLDTFRKQDMNTVLQVEDGVNDGEKFLSKTPIEELLVKQEMSRRKLWQTPLLTSNSDSKSNEPKGLKVAASLIGSLKPSESTNTTNADFLYYQCLPCTQAYDKRPMAAQEGVTPLDVPIEATSAENTTPPTPANGEDFIPPDLPATSIRPSDTQLSLFNFYAAMRDLVDSGIRCDSMLNVPLLVDTPVLRPSWVDQDTHFILGLSLAYMDRPRVKKVAKKIKKQSNNSESVVVSDKKKALELEAAQAVEAKERRAHFGAAQRRAIDPRVRLRQKEDMSLEKWLPSEDDSLLSLMEVHYPNITLVSLILNLKPAVVGRRRSPRQCQDRFAELKASKNQTNRASLSDELCRLRSASPGLLYAPWPPLRAEEGATPSVLPISRISETEYVERRRRFTLLLQCEDTKKDVAPSMSTPSVEDGTAHPSHAQCISDLKKSTDISSPIELVHFLQHPPAPNKTSSAPINNVPLSDKPFSST